MHCRLPHFARLNGRFMAALSVTILAIGAQGVPALAAPVHLSGNIEISYDDLLSELFVQGASVIGDTLQVDPTWHVAAPFSADIAGDTLVIAATVGNRGYTGGFMANLRANFGLAVTDSAWKWTLWPPPAGWEQPGYNDAAWFPVLDQGGAVDVPRMARDPRCFSVTDSCPLNPFIASGARYLWAAQDLYFRRTFQIDTACSTTIWAGSRGPSTVYLDGAEVTRSDTANIAVPGAAYLSVGQHLLAVYAATTVPLNQGIGGAMRVAVGSRSQVLQPVIGYDSLFNADTIGWDTLTMYRPLVSCDTLWKVSPVGPAGWYGPSFDDAAWWHTAILTDGFTPLDYPSAAVFSADPRPMWLPQTISFRGTILLSSLATQPHGSSRGAQRAVRIACMPGSILVQVPGAARATIDIFSRDGRCAFHGTAASSVPVRIDRRAWAAGTYIVRVNSGRTSMVRALIVAR